jgi:PAS domain S-box-containing protein
VQPAHRDEGGACDGLAMDDAASGAAAPEPLIDTVLGLVPDAAVVVDRGGAIIALNDNLRGMFGYPGDELVGQPVEVLIPERFRQRHRGQRSGYQRDPQVRAMGAGLDLHGRRRDGSEFPVDISLAPVTSAGRMLVVAAIRDITGAKEAERELRRLLAVSERHARWQEASAEIRLAAMAGDPLAKILQLIVDRTAELVGSTGALLVRDGAVVAATGSLSSSMGSPLVLPDAPDGQPVAEVAGPDLDPLVRAPLAGQLVLLAPLRGAGPGASGLVCDVAGDGDTGDAHRVVESLADQAAMAIELERARRDRERLLLADERERIARDLHDHAVQALFATGLSLQSVLPLATHPRVAERMHEAIDALDATIKQIRTAIFTLSTSPAAGSGLRAELVRLAADATRGLGFEPAVSFEGPVDNAVPPHVAEEVVAVAREALANVARHAKARTCALEVEVTTSACRLRVVDDGVGMGAAGVGNGLANMRARAEALGGGFEVTGPAGEGTCIDWHVPLG